jgi:hypothetical protein
VTVPTTEGDERRARDLPAPVLTITPGAGSARSPVAVDHAPDRQRLPVARRKVNRDEQVEVLVTPASRLNASPLDDPGGHRSDQSGALGGREEATRKQKTLVRVTPTDERLRPDDAGMPEIYDRLVVQDEFASTFGLARLGCQDELLAGVALRAAVESRSGRHPGSTSGGTHRGAFEISSPSGRVELSAGAWSRRATPGRPDGRVEE